MKRIEVLIACILSGCLVAVVIINANDDTHGTFAAVVVSCALLVSVGWLRQLIADGDQRTRHVRQDASAALRSTWDIHNDLKRLRNDLQSLRDDVDAFKVADHIAPLPDVPLPDVPPPCDFGRPLGVLRGAQSAEHVSVPPSEWIVAK